MPKFPPSRLRVLTKQRCALEKAYMQYLILKGKLAVKWSEFRAKVKQKQMEANAQKGRGKPRVNSEPQGDRTMGKCKAIQRVTAQGHRGYLDMICLNKANKRETKKLGLWDSGNSANCGVIISETLASELELKLTTSDLPTIGSAVEGQNLKIIGFVNDLQLRTRLNNNKWFPLTHKLWSVLTWMIISTLELL